MLCAALIPLALFFPASPDQDKDAKALAQELLNRGAALYDSRDAMSLALTYSEDSKVFWVDKNKDTGKYRVEVKDGRAEIEKMYRDLFNDSGQKTTSRNTVELAKFLAPDLLLIEGQFEPNIDKGKYTFVQERVKVDGKWLIHSLRLYVVGD